jgi:hypothetical protein
MSTQFLKYWNIHDKSVLLLFKKLKIVMQVTCVFHVRIPLLQIVKELQINDKAKYIYTYLALLLTLYALN